MCGWLFGGLIVWVLVMDQIANTCSALCYDSLSILSPPTPVLDLEEGDNLTMYCSIVQGQDNHDKCTVHDVEFYLLEDNISQYISKLNETMVRIDYPGLTLYDHDNDIVCCAMSEGCGGGIIQRTRIRVGNKPHKPEITGYKVKNWEELEIIWSVKDNNVYTTYTTALWKNESMATFKVCPRKSIEVYPKKNIGSCSVKFNFLNDKWHSTYTIQVEANNSRGITTSETKYIHTPDVVEPNPVNNVLVKEITSTSIELEWKSPKLNIPLWYQVNYTSEWMPPMYAAAGVTSSSTCMVTEARQSSLAKSQWVNGKTSITLKGLVPYTVYNVSITAHPTQTIGRPSLPQDCVLQTSESVPGQAPSVTRGSFEVEDKNETHKEVTVYWKPVPKRWRHGKILFYLLQYSSELEGKRRSVNVTSDKNCTKLPLRQDDTYEVSVNAATKLGLNGLLTLDIIVLLPNVKRPRKPDNWTVIAHNDTVVEMSWRAHPRDDVSYTVYWCVGNTYQCQDAVDWKEIPSAVTRTLITLCPGEHYNKYRFAISVEVAKGKGSSGMIWAACTYNINKVAPTPSITIKHTTDASTLVIKLKVDDCSASSGYVQKYEVVYCLVDSVETDKCTDSPRVVTVSLDEADGYSLEQLDEESHYRVSAYSVTQKGRSYNARTKVIQTKKAVLSQQELLILMVFTGIAVLLVLIAVIFLSARKGIRWCQKKLHVPIAGPDVRIVDSQGISDESIEDYCQLTDSSGTNKLSELKLMLDDTEDEGITFSPKHFSQDTDNQICFHDMASISDNSAIFVDLDKLDLKPPSSKLPPCYYGKPAEGPLVVAKKEEKTKKEKE